MATELHPLLESNSQDIPSASNYRIAVIVSEWNTEITHSLARACIETLKKHGAENISVFHVPGSFELSSAAAFFAKSMRFDSVICLGCVIQGATRHFDFICQAVADGLTKVGIETGIPTIFGVLTTQTQEQAQERAGGRLGNKGIEAAVTAIKMMALLHQ